MHPEMIHAIAVQQMADMQAQAQASGRVRLARQARKDRRRGHFPDPLAGVRVPDYVDDSFRSGARHTPGPDGAGSAAPATAGGRGIAGRDAA
jgi:hypothetical protein